MDLNQVTIGVRDLQRSIAFYQKLGLKLIVNSGNPYARFECPSGGATFSIHVVDDPAPNAVMLYFEVDDVVATVTKLKEAGITFETEPTDESWLWREARLSDPDGNRLCIYHAGPNRRFPPWRIKR